MLIPLRQAQVETCGGKAASLGVLLRREFPVPDGFVVPFAIHRVITDEVPARTTPTPLPGPLLEALAEALDELDADAVAVRSSASGEDTTEVSAAGQYDSTLAAQGLTAVAAAVSSCWNSLSAPRAVTYRRHLVQTDTDGGAGAGMAVIVQRHVDADSSGVLFTRSGTSDGTTIEETVIEAAGGLGPSVVSGIVTPDTYRVRVDGTVTSITADQPTRLDRVGGRLVTTVVPTRRHGGVLDDSTARRLASLGERVAEILGGPQDIEWAIAADQLWLLQARPITVVPPPVNTAVIDLPDRLILVGTPGSRGTATGSARMVRGPVDFREVQQGDILVCPFTDPAWTPLLRVAAGVITESGGVLSHAAIVAREFGIPAVLNVAGALRRIPDGAVVTIDGTTGTVTTPVHPGDRA